MSVRIAILDGPLPARPQADPVEGAGALLVFEGMVRRLESEREIAALDYAAYEPMATSELRRLSEEVLRKHGLIAIEVEHSRGRVAVGECSFRLLVAAPHRKEALAAMDEFIDRLKRDVPIWKKAVWAGPSAAAAP
jgi:molybdopterin synthase catalytic subunit